jgi:hypothetical protein
VTSYKRSDDVARKNVFLKILEFLILILFWLYFLNPYEKSRMTSSHEEKNQATKMILTLLSCGLSCESY